MDNKTAIANPGPLGLLGFGMTTLLLNLHNGGLIPLSIVIVAMGFALGGAAQIIAGVMEFKNNNLFGATAFTAYGFFWWSLILI
jgi:succinate-acetate transporter protein